MVYISVADNMGLYLYSFSGWWLMQNPAKFREKSKIRTGQSHPRSSILMSIESA